MARTIKTYELVGFNACKTSTIYLGVTVNLNFVDGNIIKGKNATLCTDNKFAQDAIENDRRFKYGNIRLVNTIEEKGEEESAVINKGAEPLVVESVKTINDLDAWFAEKGVELKSSKKSYIADLCAEHNVEFPNLKLK